jgi:hypothetical protein
MKQSELRQIVREEISKIMSESIFKKRTNEAATMYDLPIMDAQRKSLDNLNDIYFAYLADYAKSKGEDPEKMSKNDLDKKYGEEVTMKLGLPSSSKYADIAMKLKQKGLIKKQNK